MLNIAEQLLLAGMDAEKGQLRGGAAMYIHYGIAGAAAAELVKAGRLELQGGRVNVKDTSPVNDPLLDRVLTTAIRTGSVKDLDHLIFRAGAKSLRDICLKNLVKKGLLYEEEHIFLGVFKTKKYPVWNKAAAASVRTSLRSALLEITRCTPEEYTLLSILRACGMAGCILTPAERKQVSGKVKSILEKDEIGKAVACVISNIEAAAAASTGIMPMC